MADKIIAMPSDDEIFTAFKHALEVGVPENKKNILGMFEKFLGKAKEHLKKIIVLSDKGIALNLTEQTGNELLAGFIDAQGFLLKLPLQMVLGTFGAGSFTDFIESVKTGKNNRDTTVTGLVKIMSECFAQLGEKYAVTDTSDAIKAKVETLFAAHTPVA